MNEVWSDDTLRLGPCLPVHSSGSQVLFLGPRVKMGIYEGRPNRICPHTTTGRADYFGPFVNRQVCNRLSALIRLGDSELSRHNRDHQHE